MAQAIYPKHVFRVPSRALLSRPLQSLPKCWEAEVRPLTQLKGSLERLPDGAASVALFLAVTAEGARRTELDGSTGYQRQVADFRLDRSIGRTTNTLPIVFWFDQQPAQAIPLIGIFVDGQLVMRGGLTRRLVLPEGVDLRAPQMWFGPAALRLRFD